MQKPRVILLSAFYDPFISGAERFAIEMGERLTSSYEFTVVTARLRRDLPQNERKGDVRIVRVGFGYSWDKYLFPWLGARVAAKLPADLVHAVMESFAGMALVLYRRWRPSVPTLLSLQSGSLDAPRLTRWLPRWFMRTIHRAPNVIHAISRALAERAGRFGAKQVVVIPNGVDLEPFRSVQGIQKEAGLVVAIGRLHLDKGFDVLLRAFALLKKDSSVHLLIGGEGEERSRLEALISSLSLQDRVKCLGSVSRVDIPPLMAKAEVMVVPSRAEGMGIVVVEAQAAGTVVLATSVGGIPDVVRDGDTGILVPSENPSLLAEALQRLLDDSAERARLSEAALVSIDRYAWSRVAEQVDGLYRDLLIPSP